MTNKNKVIHGDYDLIPHEEYNIKAVKSFENKNIDIEKISTKEEVSLILQDYIHYTNMNYYHIWQERINLKIEEYKEYLLKILENNKK